MNNETKAITYEAWRISYQSSEQAARAAYEAYLSLLEQHKQCNVCQTCLGEYLSSAPCVCGGTGKHSDEVAGLREAVTERNALVREKEVQDCLGCIPKEQIKYVTYIHNDLQNLNESELAKVYKFIRNLIAQPPESKDE